MLKPVELRVESAWFQLLKLNYDEPISKSSFNFFSCAATQREEIDDDDDLPGPEQFVASAGAQRSWFGLASPLPANRGGSGDGGDGGAGAGAGAGVRGGGGRGDVSRSKAEVGHMVASADATPTPRKQQIIEDDGDDDSSGSLPGPDAFLASAGAQRSWMVWTCNVYITRV